MADDGVVVVEVGASEGRAGDVEGGVRSPKKSMSSGELAASGDDGSEEEAETGGEGTERVWTKPGRRWEEEEEEGAKRDERECDTGNADEGTEVIKADEEDEDDDDDECCEGAGGLEGGLVADEEAGAEGNEVVGGAAGRSLV